MPDFQLTTTVAFIIFNRPDTTERVFAEIAKAKPPKLLVVGDGARVNREGEAAKVAATRAIIDRVDWPCEVLTNFSEVNLGCKIRVSSGLDWVFEQVDEAIILEDDCLPHPTFFRFCQELLEKYRDDQRVGMISGDNFQFGHRLNDDSYYFSNFNHIWGWASWRSRWQHDYDVTMKDWPKIYDEGRMGDWFCTKAEKDYFAETFEKVHQGKIDTWDYQWNFASRLNGRIAVMPNINMISNIGFGDDATHTTGGSGLADMAVEEMVFPLKHPKAVFASITLDKRFSNLFSKTSLIKRIKTSLQKLIYANL
ncbi:GT4_BshA-like domain containing protein [Methylophilaceae bacterium]